MSAVKQYTLELRTKEIQELQEALVYHIESELEPNLKQTVRETDYNANADLRRRISLFKDIETRLDGALGAPAYNLILKLDDVRDLQAMLLHHIDSVMLPFIEQIEKQKKPVGDLKQRVAVVQGVLAKLNRLVGPSKIPVYKAPGRPLGAVVSKSSKSDDQVSGDYVLKGDSNVSKLSEVLMHTDDGTFVFSDLKNIGTNYVCVTGSGLEIKRSTVVGNVSDKDRSYAHWGLYGRISEPAMSDVKYGNFSLSVGVQAQASGMASVAFGTDSHASAEGSAAFGSGKASGEFSLAQGQSTSSGDYASAFGNSKAIGFYSFAEGLSEEGQGAVGSVSHVEGYHNNALGDYSHAQGMNTVASGQASFAAGKGTTAGYAAQTSLGKFNSNNEDTLLEVGNGTQEKPSNAFEVLDNGFIRTGDNSSIAFGKDAEGRYGYYSEDDLRHYFFGTGDATFVFGYFNTEDELFYKDSDLTELIEGNVKDIYVDQFKENLFRFDGESFIRVSGIGEAGPYIAIDENDVISVDSDTIEFSMPSDGSIKLLTSGAAKSALDLKQDNLISGYGIEIVDNIISFILDASGIEYDNSISGLMAEDVQAALDELDAGVDFLADSKQDNLTAGENISISNENVISAVDTLYTAGNGLALNDTEFSIDADAEDIRYDNTTSGLSGNNVQEVIDSLDVVTKELDRTKQDNLTAGYGIDLTNNVVSLDIDASGISYDNTTSGLSAKNLQEAVDELSDEKAEVTALSDGSVTRLGTSDVGSLILPIYLNGGTPEAVEVAGTVTSESDKLITSKGVFNYVKGKMSSVYDFKGSLENRVRLLVVQNDPETKEGDVYNLLYDEPELHAPAGTNIAFIKSPVQSAAIKDNWDVIGGQYNEGEFIEISESGIISALADSDLTSVSDSHLITSKAVRTALNDGSVSKVGKIDVGSVNVPVYLKDGVPTVMSGQLPVANGGTGASTAEQALVNFGALPLAGGTMSGSLLLGKNGNVYANIIPVESGENTLGDQTHHFKAGYFDDLTINQSISVDSINNIHDLIVGRDASIARNLTVGGTSEFTDAATFARSVSADSLGVTDDLTVGGDGTVSGTLTAGNLVSNGNLAVTGSANFAADATVSGTLTVVEDLSVSGDAGVIGDLSVGGGLTLTGDLTGENVTARNDISAGRDLSVTRNLTVGGTGTIDSLSVTNDQSVGGDLSVTGSVSADSGTLTNDLSIGGDANVTGDISAVNETLSGNISVGGNAIVTGNVSGDNLMATSDLTVGGNAIVTGDITGDDITAESNLTVGGDASVTGGVSANMGNIATDLTVGGDATVTGNITGSVITATDHFAGNLVGDVTGNVSGEVISASDHFVGDLTGNVTGNVSGEVLSASDHFAGDLIGNVTGNVEGNLTGNVEGNVNGDLTGNVTGNVTGDLTGNADTATALQHARTFQIDLESSSGASFDGTENVTPGVSGELPLVHGGTGSSTAEGALQNLGALPTAGGQMTGTLTLGKNGSVYSDIIPAENKKNSLGDVEHYFKNGYINDLSIGNTLTSKSLSLENDLTVGGNAAVTGNLTLTGSANVTGDVFSANLTASTDLIVGRNASVTGNGTIGGSLSVTGDITGNDLTANGDLTVDGDGLVKGGLTVNGNISGTVVTATDHFEGDLTGDVIGDVTGNLTGNVAGESVTAEVITASEQFVGDLVGDVTGNADTATSLETSRSLQVNLESTHSVSFNGTSDVLIGVSGVLPVENGGTGFNSVDSTPTEGSTKMVTSGGVKSAIDVAISTVYKLAGDKRFEDLDATLLVQGNLGKVYNISTPGVTTSDFVQGAGKTVEVGDNVTVVDTGTDGTPVYKFDLMSGMVDISGKVDKTTTVNGHALSTDIEVTKSDVGLSDVVNTGDSATPVEGGLTKFTTGGAYTELNKKQDKTLSSPITVDSVAQTTVESALSALKVLAEANKVELSDKVNVDDLYDSEITVKVNGSSIGSFTLNQSSADEFDIEVPTALTDLDNDGYFVQDADYVHTDNNYADEEKEKLAGIEDGAEVNTITGVKGSEEQVYRTGDVSISKSDIGLGNVPNVTTDNQTPTVETAQSRELYAQGDTLRTIISKVRKYLDDLEPIAFSGDYSDLSGTPPVPDADEIDYDNSTSGLSAGNVQAAIDELTSEKQDNLTSGDFIDITNNEVSVTGRGQADGLASLDSNGLVPRSELPSDVIEGYFNLTDNLFYEENTYITPITGSAERIYVSLDTNLLYRYDSDNSEFVATASLLELGETSDTAYRGDRGKTAYDHATETRLTTATASGLYKVASTSEGHIASLTAVVKKDITDLGIPGEAKTYTAGDGIDITNDVVSLSYFSVVNGAVNITYSA